MSDFRTFYTKSPIRLFRQVGDNLTVKCRSCIRLADGNVMDGYLETLEDTSALDQEELRGGDTVYLVTQDRLWQCKILKR